MDSKKRTSNYSAGETTLLLKLANQHKNIIENKGTGSFTWKEKDKVWEKISAEFNASSTSGPTRTSKQLRSKYESIKKNIRKEYSIHKASTLENGDGSIEDPKPKTEEEKELLETLALSVAGVSCQSDSDGLAEIQGVSSEGNNHEKRAVDTEVNVDLSSQSCKCLQTPKDVALKKKLIDQPLEEVTSEIEQLEENARENVAQPSPEPESLPLESTSSRSRRRRQARDAKFEALAQEKMELVKIQKALLEQTKLHHEVEHRQRMENLKLENEILKIKMESLKKQ